MKSILKKHAEDNFKKYIYKCKSRRKADGC